MDAKKKQSAATPKKPSKKANQRKPEDLTPVSELKKVTFVCNLLTHIKPKKAPLKQVFDSPFTFKWPKASDADQTFVLGNT